jgi:phage/plasmid-like protein (TIGR03299 family)
VKKEPRKKGITKMAHAIESMMYAGETPWHGLGKEVSENINVEDAISAAGLDWNVNKAPMQVIANVQGTMRLIDVPDAHAIVRDTDGMVLGTTGRVWKPLQNKDAFAWFNPFLEMNQARLHTAGSLHDGQNVWILAKLNLDTVEIRKNDPVEAFVLLSNYHDGKTALRVGFTPVRVVCANTLAAAYGNTESKLLRVRHSLKTKSNLDLIREAMDTASQTFKMTAERMQLLASRGVRGADLHKYVEQVFEIKAHENTTKWNRVFPQIEHLFTEGKGNGGNTLWDAYNAVTEFLSHRDKKDTETRYDSLWFGANAATNARALSVALEMYNAV